MSKSEYGRVLRTLLDDDDWVSYEQLARAVEAIDGFYEHLRTRCLRFIGNPHRESALGLVRLIGIHGVQAELNAFCGWAA